MTNDAQFNEEITSGGGWTCPKCLQWVGPGQSHVCPQPETFTLSWITEDPANIRIVMALEKIVDLLEKIEKKP